MSDGLEGLRLFPTVKPDLVICELDLPGMNGYDMISRMLGCGLGKPISRFTGTANIELAREALSLKIQGFVHKTESMDIFRQAIDLVARDTLFFTPYAHKRLQQSGLRNEAVEKLNVKERNVLQLIAEGSGSKQIAARLALSIKTVEHYRKNLSRKLDLHSVASLTRYAVRCGLVT